jgi:hypothetical protein
MFIMLPAASAPLPGKGEEQMQSSRTGGTRRGAIGGILTAVVLAVGLLTSAGAVAAPDPLSGGSVNLQLRNVGGLKVKPKSLSLPITGGALDPTNGAGSVQTSGKFRVRQGKDKAKVKVLTLNLGANGGAGSLDAKIGKRKVNGFGKLSGGTLTRDGWGAKLDGVTMKLGGKGAKALRRAFSGGKGKASAAAGGIKAGKPLGSVSLRSVPKEVEVLPGGTLVFESNPLFGITLARHCVNLSLAGGIEPIPPATEPALGEFIFPVVGGSIAPDFSTGKVISEGGQKLTKNDDGTIFPATSGCSQPPPVGTTVIQTEWQAQFDLRALATSVTFPPPTGNIGIGSLGPFDLAAATTSADPNTRQVTVSGAPVTMDPLSATIFNNVFPTGTGNPSHDFMGGALLGSFSFTVTTH